jgi:O-succinylbenzoic acid--CoA ligase
MPALIALDLPPGDAFVDQLRHAWDDGGAVLPLDARLPIPARDQLLAAMRPAAVIDEQGDRSPLAGSRPVEPGDALVVTTSGSMGAPKGVILTHDALRASAVASSARLEIEPDRDRWLCCLPVAHVGGLGVVTRALVTNTPLEIHPRFDAAAVTAAALEHGATRTSLVATALQRLDPAIFRTILLGGAAPPALVPANTVVTYGMTESGGGVVYDGWPLDGVEVRIVDGEVQLRGPMLLRAYREGDGDRNPRTDEGWFATDDAGAVAEDGRVTIQGRRGDVIVSGGEKVWPAAVELVLGRHAAIDQVAVTGRADPEWGQRVVAVIVPADFGRPPSLEELREWVKAELGPYCAPRGVEVVESLPRTLLGKINRREIGRAPQVKQVIDLSTDV